MGQRCAPRVCSVERTKDLTNFSRTFLLSPGRKRMSSPSNVSVLVYSDKPPRMDAHDPPTCAPRTVCTGSRPRAHRPLFFRCRGPHPAGSSTPVSVSAAGPSRHHSSTFATHVHVFLHHRSRPRKKHIIECSSRRTHQEAWPCPRVGREETDEDIP